MPNKTLKRIFASTVILFSFSEIAIAQEAEAIFTDEPMFYYISGAFLAFTILFSVYMTIQMLKGNFSVSEKMKMRLIIFFYSLPFILIMALFVKDFNGSYVFAITGAIIGFAAGNVFSLLPKSKEN